MTVIRWSTLATAGYDPTAAELAARVTTGSAQETAPIVTLQRLDALAQTRRDFDVIAYTLPPTSPVDGLLGLDFFRDTRLTIDFRVGTITVD